MPASFTRFSAHDGTVTDDVDEVALHMINQMGEDGARALADTISRMLTGNTQNEATAKFRAMDKAVRIGMHGHLRRIGVEGVPVAPEGSPRARLLISLDKVGIV